MKKVKILITVIAIILIVIFIKNRINTPNVEYEISEVNIYKYLKYKKNENFGVIDREGNIIIEAKYSNIQIPNPSKDLFICYEENNEQSTVLNSSIEILFGEYENIELIKLKNIASTLCYEKSTLIYKKDDLYGLIDFDGKKLTKNIYTTIENLQGTEGKFLVSKDGKYGVININGATLVKTEYDGVTTDNYKDFKKEGFVTLNTTENGYRYGYVDYKGEKILDTEYNDLIRITDFDDIYLIASINGQYGLFKEKKQIIKSEYQSISATSNGAIIIEKNSKFGIADINGEIKVEPKYEQIEAIGIYLYAKTIKDNDVYDTQGNKIDILFNKSVYETENENYRITTLLNNDITYYGIESKEGKKLVDTRYNYIEYIYGDYFIVEDSNEKYGVISSNGKVKVECEYDLIQKIKDKNIIQVSKMNSKQLILYSLNMEEIASLKSAKIQNKINYIKVYNDKEEKYFDKDGNKIKENSEIIQNELLSELPEKIGEYTKIQYSLDDAYYEL